MEESLPWNQIERPEEEENKDLIQNQNNRKQKQSPSLYVGKEQRRSFHILVDKL